MTLQKLHLKDEMDVSEKLEVAKNLKKCFSSNDDSSEENDGKKEDLEDLDHDLEHDRDDLEHEKGDHDSKRINDSDDSDGLYF